MISSLTGRIEHLGLDEAVINVGGVGYHFSATPETVSTLRRGEDATVHTRMAVRDEVPVLFGFTSADEREVFDSLTTVSGIGPRIALAVLAVFEPEEVRIAVYQEDTKAFTKVPGIGPKTAGRLILELTGKLVPTGEPTQSKTEKKDSGEPAWQDQVQEALIGLGWNDKDAKKAIQTTLEDEPGLAETSDVSEVLRVTLRHLGQAQGVRGGRR